MSYPLEQPYCEEWSEEKQTCLKGYPDTCHNHRECQLINDPKERAKADRADLESRIPKAWN